MSEKKLLKLAIAAGALAGVALPAAPAFAQNTWTPSVFTVLEPDMNDLARVRDGRLRKTDEEFTNEQADVAFFGDGKHAIFVSMRTGALPSGETPVHRMQAACVPMELQQAADGSINFVAIPGTKFITDNDGNEYRNANIPDVEPINGGMNMLVMFNYQPQGTNDTRRYAKVLDMNCNEIPITNGNGDPRKQVTIMAKNNDDCSMHQAGNGPCDMSTAADGSNHLTCWAGCNGNGEDDGWLNDFSVKCANGADGAATSCQIKKNFDISLAQREERSRGRCSVASSDPNTAICTWTEGNNQPQREGTWIAAVDISSGGEQGEDAQSRLLWKEQVDGRKDMGEYRTYSVRANHMRLLVPKADGSLEKSDMIVYFNSDLEGRNNDDKKGGTYHAMNFQVFRATAAGLEEITPQQNLNDLLLGIDSTHLTTCGAVFGEGANLMPGFTLMQGSQNGGGVSEPQIKAIGYDMTQKKFIDLGTHRAGGSYDRHLYSNYLGNNPGNQGRNFAGCTLAKNPFAGQNGSTAQYFVVHALTGKDPQYLENAAIKPTSYVTLMPVSTITPAAPPPQDPPPMDPPPPGDTTPPGGGSTTPPGATDTPEDTSEAGAPSMMGCSAAAGGAGGASGALLVLLAVGFVFINRRRGA